MLTENICVHSNCSYIDFVPSLLLKLTDHTKDIEKILEEEYERNKTGSIT